MRNFLPVPRQRVRSVPAAIALLALLLLPAAKALAQETARIAATVNDEVISVNDVLSRAQLMVFSSGLPPTQETFGRLMPQVLNSLIDERLQLQEARAGKISISQDEIDGVLANLEQQNKLPPGGLDGFLKERGIDKATLVAQVQANLAWARLIQPRFQRQVDVSEEEIDTVLEQIQSARSQPRQMVSEIFLAVDDPAGEEQARAAAARIVQQLRDGADFASLARAFSQNSAATSGGDLGWLVQGQLQPQLERALASIQPGQVVGPVRSDLGYHIVMLRAREGAGAGAGAGKTVVDLRQIILPLADAADEATVRTAIAAMENIRAEIKSCAALETATLPPDTKVINVGRVRVADLAEPLRAPILALATGQMSAPIRTPVSTMLLMSCGREESGGPALPDRQQIRQKLVRDKIDLLARRLLRDLRRAAVVDIRK